MTKYEDLTEVALEAWVDSGDPEAFTEWKRRQCEVGDARCTPGAGKGAASPLSPLLGKPGDPIRCKVIAEDISVHWWPRAAKAGDRCLCGERTKTDEE